MTETPTRTRSYTLKRGEPERAQQVDDIARIYQALTGGSLSSVSRTRLAALGVTEFFAVLQRWRRLDAERVKAKEKPLALLEVRA